MRLILALTGGFCSPLASQETCSRPAYAHNDYENRRPLFTALEAGYAGVEVDVYLVDGRLLVGHDAANLRLERTLTSMYIEPLRRILAERGTICPAGRPFLLTIEIKHQSQAAMDSVMALEDMFRLSPGTDGPPVRIVHVGWLPQSSRSETRPPAIQHRVRSAEDLDRMPDDPAVVLISVRYRDLFRWQGRGVREASFQPRLDTLVSRAHQLTRLLRVYDVPYSEPVFRALLGAGVDLLGIEDLPRGSAILDRIQQRGTGH